MKILTLLIGFSFLTLTGYSQSEVPRVDIRNFDFETFNTGNIANEGKPIIISFWATWCAPCKRELNNIADEWEYWEETGVKVYAVSIDDSRTVSTVQSYVNGQEWPYEVLIDENSEFRRAMNVNNIPHTFLLDGTGKIVYQHNGYSPGDEEEIFELIEKLNSGESL